MKNVRKYLASSVLAASMAVTPLSVFADSSTPVQTKGEIGTTYTVVKGDTLYKIATSHGTVVEKVMEWNGLKSYTLSIGQQLKLYPTEVTPTPEPPVVTPPTSESVTYKVIKGDTLYKIATKYHTTVESLMLWNSLNNYTLSVGQTLKVSEPKTYVTHTVVKGDTLYRIATANGVTVESVISLNDLKSYTLTIGQVLKVKAN